MKRKTNAGFTLIEMLLVLTIISVCMLLTIASSQTYAEGRKLDYLVRQFREDVLYGQYFAMTRKKSVYIAFYDRDTHVEYAIYDTSIYGKALISRILPEGVTFSLGTLGQLLYYNSTGNINKSGTMFIESGHHKYKVVFLLGRGRFYVEKA